MKQEVNNLAGTLTKTPCGGGLTRCCAAKSAPLQLYFFTSGTSQQTFLLVLDKDHGAAGSDAMRPKALVEFQPAPGLKIPMTAPALTLTDATFFIDNELVFG